MPKRMPKRITPNWSPMETIFEEDIFEPAPHDYPTASIETVLGEKFDGLSLVPKQQLAEEYFQSRKARQCSKKLEQRLASDVAQLEDFLRGQLFDEYSGMKGTPMDQKNETWLTYGRCIMVGLERCECKPAETGRQRRRLRTFDLGDPRVEERLFAMVDASGLDPEWVRDHLLDYHAGSSRAGQWQQYVRECRWMELAAKFSADMQQLETINRADPSGGRPCEMMYHIRNIKRQYFNRLDGAEDYELSKMALMGDDDGCENSSFTSSSTTSSSSLFSV